LGEPVPIAAGTPASCAQVIDATSGESDVGVAVQLTEPLGTTSV